MDSYIFSSVLFINYKIRHGSTHFFPPIRENSIYYLLSKAFAFHPNVKALIFIIVITNHDSFLVLKTHLVHATYTATALQ